MYRVIKEQTGYSIVNGRLLGTLVPLTDSQLTDSQNRNRVFIHKSDAQELAFLLNSGKTVQESLSIIGDIEMIIL